jgi:hypothetical protein
MSRRANKQNKNPKPIRYNQKIRPKKRNFFIKTGMVFLLVVVVGSFVASSLNGYLN